MWQSLHDAWWRLATQSHPHSFGDILASSALKVGATAYGASVSLRNTAYDRGWAKQVRLPCRVVSVGNLTVGGTGKTACVALIAKKLLAQGRRVAILSRGYGGSSDPYWLRWEDDRLVVTGAGRAASRRLADEPQWLARRLPGVPIVVGAKRERSGRLACATLGAEIAILDDGFQHRRVQRDCDIVLVHARMPFSGWAVLPRGPMREPLAALARAHVIIATKADEAFGTLGALAERLRSFNADAAFVTASHEPTELVDGATGERQDLARLAGMRVGLLSSIGDPSGFEATVNRLQASAVWHRAFPDHHPYREEDWAKIVEWAAASRPDAIVTTEKDWVRLAPHLAPRTSGSVPVWVLGVQMKILSGEELLDGRLAGVCAR